MPNENTRPASPAARVGLVLLVAAATYLACLFAFMSWFDAHWPLGAEFLGWVAYAALLGAAASGAVGYRSGLGKSVCILASGLALLVTAWIVSFSPGPPPERARRFLSPGEPGPTAPAGPRNRPGH